MVRFLKTFFKRKRYIKISYFGKFGVEIDTNFTDDEVQEFLYSIYTDQVINDIMDHLKVYKEDQYARVVKFLEERAKQAQEEMEEEDNGPIVGVLSENNNMGRS